MIIPENKMIQCPICSNNQVKLYIRKYDDRFGMKGYFDYYACERCESGFIWDDMSKEELRHVYEKYYNLTSEKGNKISGLRKKIRLLLDSNFIRILSGDMLLLNSVKNWSRVLEIGPGNVKRSKLVIKRKNLDWTGLEIDSSNCEKISAQGLKSICGIVEDLNGNNEKFDAIVLSQAIEHQKDINSFFVYIKNLQNAGGKLFLTTPNWISDYRKKYGEKWINWHSPYHRIFLSRTALGILAKKHGYSVGKFKTFTPTSWYSMQKKFRLPKIGEINKSILSDHSLLKQMIISIYLKIKESINSKSEDCIYCELIKK